MEWFWGHVNWKRDWHVLLQSKFCAPETKRVNRTLRWGEHLGTSLLASH